MQTEILIIGQGISGSFLSYWLEKEGVSTIVIDEERPFTPSRAAAGIINPVTGRRIVKTWMIDELLPFAIDTYQRMNEEYDISCFSITEMIDFFPTAQMRNAFIERHGAEYLQLPADEHIWDPWFRYDLGYGRIQPCCIVDLRSLLSAIRQRLKVRGQLLEEQFEPAALKLSEKSKSGDSVSGDSDSGDSNSGSSNSILSKSAVRYKDITADKIIFCDGAGSFESPLFRNLPFAPNKGEVLIVEIEGMPTGPIFKKGMTLAPWREGLYWLGSSYEWSFNNTQPTDVFRRRATATLEEWLKLPFKIVDHIASVRPATLERRPFVGFHPQFPQVGILNGMGTKGCSLAPFFAKQLAKHIKKGLPLQPDVDVKRFEKVLSK